MKTKFLLALSICLFTTGCDPDDLIDSTVKVDNNIDEYLSKSQKLYDVKPDLANCESGVLKDSVKQEVITTLNDMRKLSGLSPVTYDYSSDNEVMSSSLIFAANGKTSHYPDESWKCYSAAGSTTASDSNISGGVGNLEFQTVEDQLVSWMHDVRNVKKNNIGHRRWLLSPFLKKVSFGKVSAKYGNDTVVNGATIKVIYPKDDSHGFSESEIIAYPVKNYPSKYFHRDALLSLSILDDANDFWNNDTVDFSEAVIKVTHRDGDKQEIKVTNIATDNKSYGLPNSLQFKIKPLSYNTTYDVSVTGISVNGKNKDINYWFNIVD